MIVSHQAVLRALYGYFMNQPLEVRMGRVGGRLVTGACTPVPSHPSRPLIGLLAGTWRMLLAGRHMPRSPSACAPHSPLTWNC